MGDRLRIGVSSCLLGNEVRYDGAHSRNACILDSMGELFEFVAFCPEVAIGLGVPRPPINLIVINGEIRLRGVSDISHDVTDMLIDYANSASANLDLLDGYIFKSRSPSCGLSDVNVYEHKTNRVVDTSAGQFAKIIVKQYPQLPVEDELGLSDKKTRDNFIRRVVVYSQRK